jgi:hypothetical protein
VTFVGSFLSSLASAHAAQRGRVTIYHPARRLELNPRLPFDPGQLRHGHGLGQYQLGVGREDTMGEAPPPPRWWWWSWAGTSCCNSPWTGSGFLVVLVVLIVAQVDRNVRAPPLIPFHHQSHPPPPLPSTLVVRRCTRRAVPRHGRVPRDACRPPPHREWHRSRLPHPTTGSISSHPSPLPPPPSSSHPPWRIAGIWRVGRHPRWTMIYILHAASSSIPVSHLIPDNCVMVMAWGNTNSVSGAKIRWVRLLLHLGGGGRGLGRAAATRLGQAQDSLSSLSSSSSLKSTGM